MAFVDATTGGRVIKEGIRPVKVTLSGAVKVGDLIGYSSGWKAADMNSSPKVYPELIAGSTGASGDEIVAYGGAVIDFGTGCTATAGDKIYSSTDAGQYVGAASNDQARVAGTMVSAQVAFIELEDVVFSGVKTTTVYTITSGHAIVMQLKPQLSATGTASLTCIELVPKALDAVAGGTIQGITIQVDLEGASAGTITTARGIEVSLGSDSGTVRTVTNAQCFEATNNFHGTITTGPFVIKVNTAGGNVAWAGLVYAPDDGAIAKYNEDKTGGTKGWIKCRIGAYTGYILVATLA